MVASWGRTQVALAGLRFVGTGLGTMWDLEELIAGDWLYLKGCARSWCFPCTDSIFLDPEVLWEPYSHGGLGCGWGSLSDLSPLV